MIGAYHQVTIVDRQAASKAIPFAQPFRAQPPVLDPALALGFEHVHRLPTCPATYQQYAIL